MRDKEPGSSTRKPYRVSKQRCPWSADEHALFLEAIERYGRAWPKIVAHIGTRSVQQVRSHAQKYFLKLEKSGNRDAVPPPRPKKRAARPYPTSSARRSRVDRTGRSSAGQGDASGAEDSEVADWPACSSERPASEPNGGAATTRAAARVKEQAVDAAPLRDTVVASPIKAEGDGSNGDHSDGTCPDNSGLSTGDNAFAAGLGDGLDVARGSFAVAPLAQKQDVTGAAAEPGRADAPAGSPEAGSLAGEASAPGSNDFGRLYDLVGSLYEVGPEANQRMLAQLEPSQRASLAAMMGHLSGNLRANCDAGDLSVNRDPGGRGALPTPFAAPAVQAPAAAARSLTAAGGPLDPEYGLPAALEPFSRGPERAGEQGFGVGLATSGLLDESSSVPQLVGLPPPLAPQPDAELLITADPNPDPNPSRAPRYEGGVCEVGGGLVHRGTDAVAAARDTEAHAQQAYALAAQQQYMQQQYLQLMPQALRHGANAEQLRQAAQLAHHQAELAQAQAQLLPQGLLPVQLSPPCTQPAPTVPADFLPKWQAEGDPAWQTDGDPGNDILVPGLFGFC